MKHAHDGEINHKVELPEGITTGFVRIKQHVQEHKKTYLAGAGCLVAGVVFGKNHQRPIVIDFKPVINNIPTISVAPVLNNIVNNTVNDGGYSRKIVRCLETDQMWPSMKAAAEATGNHVTMMSKHCNGRVEDLQGLHYAIEGLAAG